jgi:hypothetical protein
MSRKYLVSRASPFYPILMGFLIKLHGFKELALRGALGPRDLETQVRGLPQADDSQVTVADVTKMVEKLGGPLELKSRVDPTNIPISADEIAGELIDNHSYLLSEGVSAAIETVILAHERAKAMGFAKRTAMWEFLRHCRNAAAHNGQFTFGPDEPRRLAEWRGVTLDNSLNGTPLFKGETGSGLLWPGDVVILLHDLANDLQALNNTRGTLELIQ